jgi:hypothetical protein
LQEQVEDEGGNDNVFADGQEEEVLIQDDMANGDTPICITYRQYSYDGRFWHIPKDFEFPKGLHLDIAWKMWVNGLPGNKTIQSNGTRCQAPIRPICSMKLDMLPKYAKRDFQLHCWRPIFLLMEQVLPGLNIRQGVLINAAYVTASFDTAREHLKSRVSYVFANKRSNPDRWEIWTWSQKVQRSSILKNGTDEDKANLPEETLHRNKPRQQCGRKKSLSD